MSNDNADNFIEVLNRIARVPVSSVPPRKPQQSSDSDSGNSPAQDSNK